MSGFSGAGGAFGAAQAWDPTATGAAVARLGEAREGANRAVLALRSAPDLAVAPAPGVSLTGLRACGAELDARAAAAQALQLELEDLQRDTWLAGRSYEWASDAVRGLIEQVAGSVAYALGAAVRTAALAAAPWAVAIGLVVVPLAAKLLLMHPELLASLTQRAAAAGTNLGRFLEDTSAFWERTGEVLMANPAFTAALALAIESSDEALAGLLGIPLPLANSVESRIGDDEVLGLLALSAAGGAGLLSGGGRVQAVFSRPVAPPSEPVTEPAQAMRIILEQDEQVTIAEYAMPDGSTRYQVFVRGTETVAPSGSSGLDMRANLENTGAAGSQLHGSDAAVAEAMREAGIGPGDAVDLFGFSQGAGAVANVAASGQFRVENALLVGGPVGGAEIPPQTAVLSIAHEGDIVPALDGWADGEGVQTTVIESAGGHGSGPLARHSGEEYVDTLDRLDDFAGDAWLARIEAATAGGEPISGVGVHLRRR
ncbi:hypothetical protein SAMN04487783_1450 [Agrococcus baldri]|uniref:Alpha/beta hydrolase n=1 Tax=Agrococcus baldri TaxID=153730 RepID=A0AA94KZK0_9MICO|nr:hypothetical protein [Agrococcus baldri]SFS10712.1 hypothetical protein SAMN04487783_1450 [Agrococcus baldri]